MYSRIPMPQVRWNEENKRYALCFFPVIGIVIGMLQIGLRYLCDYSGIGQGMYAAIAVGIPVIITGGIHLDGYMDVHDAMGCMGDKDRKLEVMKDSRIGAFAAIYLVLYFVVQFGIFYEIKKINQICVIAFVFVVSRAMSGLAAVTFKAAKRGGTLNSFSKPAHKNITIVTEVAFIMISCVLMIYISFVGGVCAMMGCFVTFLYYRVFSYKEFGGITGDTEGYFLQLCELISMLFAVVATAICF